MLLNRRDLLRVSAASVGSITLAACTTSDGGGSSTSPGGPSDPDAAPIDIRPEAKHRLWANIACPVLLCYGLQSWASNPAEDGRAQHFRDARVELFDNAGHWPHHDRREDFIAIVRDFLR